MVPGQKRGGLGGARRFLSSPRDPPPCEGSPPLGPLAGDYLAKKSQEKFNFGIPTTIVG